MGDNFRISAEIGTDKANWGHSRWVSNPASTGAKQLTVLDAALAAGQAHSFHKHPRQEEVMYVVSGGSNNGSTGRSGFGSGDAAFIPAGVVHATFNSAGEARLLVIFSPCIGDGFEPIDVSGEAPWNGLRN
jgi:quercetin dioxygenase-like cupin family protein